MYNNDKIINNTNYVYDSKRSFRGRSKNEKYRFPSKVVVRIN